MTASERADQDDAQGSKYRAPALEKGLDVLELLVADRRIFTLRRNSRT